MSLPLSPLEWESRVTCPTHLKINFTRHLSTMLASGVPLADALKVLTCQPESENLEMVVDGISRSVASGSTMSEAYEKFPKVFAPIYIGMIKVGEQTGQLTDCLAQLADWLERDMATYRKLRVALTYPCLILAVAALLAIILFATVLPEFLNIFTSLNCPLPVLTQALMPCIAVLSNPGTVILLVTGCLVVFSLARSAWLDEDARFRLTSFALSLPVLGDLLRFAALTRFAHAAELGLSAGMDLVAVLRLGGSACANPVLSRNLALAVDSVMGGLSLSEHMRLHPRLFDPTFVHLVQSGEESAQMPKAMGRASQFFGAELEHRVTNFTKLVEPLMLFLVAGVVGTILLAVFLPLYSYLGNL